MITNTFSQDRRVDNIPTFDDRKLHYGFYLGVNQNDFKINLRDSNYPNAEIQSEPTIGFNVGLIADYRLHKNLNLRFEPGLVSNTKTITFNTTYNKVQEVSSTYLHIPLILKFSTDRIGNVRPYLLAGISYDYNFSSNENNQDDNFANEFRMKTSNFMYEVGIGMDFYLNFFKFSPSIRGIFALSNEIEYDNPANGPSQWTDPVNYFGTRGIFLNFAFE
jgi:outer membrane protein W